MKGAIALIVFLGVGLIVVGFLAGRESVRDETLAELLEVDYLNRRLSERLIDCENDLLADAVPDTIYVDLDTVLDY